MVNFVQQSSMGQEKATGSSLGPSYSAKKAVSSGKGKENASLNPVTPSENSKQVEEGEEWAWTTLADSAVSKHPPVFTSDGK